MAPPADDKLIKQMIKLAKKEEKDAKLREQQRKLEKEVNDKLDARDRNKRGRHHKEH